MRGEKGFALVITLLVTALLLALLGEFVNEVYVDTSHSHNFVASQQASILAESGAAAATKLLQASALLRDGKQYSSLLEPWAQPQSYDTGNGTVTFTVEEESGKLDLNSATTQSEGGTPDLFYQQAAQRLLKNLGLSPDLYDAIADWVDTGDTPRPGGAESSYYLTLNPPYQAHNNRLDTVDELALVKGVTPDVLLKLRSCVTVYGSGTDFGSAPTAKININTAPKELLAALDDELSRGDLVERILDYRKNKPIMNLSDVPGLGSLIQLLGKITFQGTVYRIHAEGKVRDSIAVVEAVVTDTDTQKPRVLYWREY